MAWPSWQHDSAGPRAVGTSPVPCTEPGRGAWMGSSHAGREAHTPAARSSDAGGAASPERRRCGTARQHTTLRVYDCYCATSGEEQRPRQSDVGQQMALKGGDREGGDQGFLTLERTSGSTEMVAIAACAARASCVATTSVVVRRRIDAAARGMRMCVTPHDRSATQHDNSLRTSRAWSRGSRCKGASPA
jgi:hypothetical protein